MDEYPARTTGVSYYHRLKLRLHSLRDEFLSCPNRTFTDGFFLVRTFDSVIII